MMKKCGFIYVNFDTEIKDLTDIELGNTLENRAKYYSIAFDESYYIFVDRELYIEYNADKISAILIQLNRELMMSI